MSEINSNLGADTHGKIRSKKSSTRIDMTPMVDLAFLLLTFFVLTSALSKPFALRIDMPEDSPEHQPPINVRRALTLMLKEDNKIYWYNGSGPDVRLTSFSASGVRKVLLQRKKETPNLYVFIKASDQSRYQNLVDILDEMIVTEIKHYAVVDFTSDDEELIRNAARTQ